MLEPTVFKNGYALMVGVGADLSVTIKDATAIRDILIDSQRCAYPVNQVRLLTEEKASRQNILDSLDRLATQVSVETEATVVVYFSGHGGMMPEFHLVPNGYDPQNFAGTAISGAEFTEKLRAIKAKKLLVLLDCCHAGGMAAVKAPGFVKAPIPPEMESILSAGSGRVVIASSRKDEFSYTGTPYSVFTQALLEALAGYGASEQDGYAYLTDVALYVGRMVPNRTNDRQHPILKLAGADNFAIAYYAGGAKSPIPLEIAFANPIPLERLDVDLVEGYQKILNQLKVQLLEIEDRIARFYDKDYVPPDFDRMREGKLIQITETETKIEQLAKDSGWMQPPSPPPGITMEDLMNRLDRLEAVIGGKLDDLKQGQVVIYQHLTTQDQITLETILSEVHLGRVEQGQLSKTVDAIRRALKHIQDAGIPMDDPQIEQSLHEIYIAVNSNLGLQQQFELSLPVLPFLNYKVSLGAGFDLGAVWKELKDRYLRER